MGRSIQIAKIGRKGFNGRKGKYINMSCASLINRINPSAETF